MKGITKTESALAYITRMGYTHWHCPKCNVRVDRHPDTTRCPNLRPKVPPELVQAAVQTEGPKQSEQGE